MRSLMLFMGGLARFFYRMIATPVLLGWMIGRTAFGAMIGFLIGVVVALSTFGHPLGQSAWEWAVLLPPTFIGAVFGFQYWRMVSGINPRLWRKSHATTSTLSSRDCSSRKTSDRKDEPK